MGLTPCVGGADGIANANPAPLAMVTGDEASGFVATIAVTVA